MPSLEGSEWILQHSRAHQFFPLWVCLGSMIKTFITIITPAFIAASIIFGCYRRLFGGKLEPLTRCGARVEPPPLHMRVVVLGKQIGMAYSLGAACCLGLKVGIPLHMYLLR